MATKKCDKCHNSAFTALSLALSVTCWCGEGEVVGSIPGTGAIHVGLKKLRWGVLPLPCKQLDLCLSRMTT